MGKWDDYTPPMCVLFTDCQNNLVLCPPNFPPHSARIQTVKREDNPIYYDLINEYYKLTGVPAIINTSFNVRGEPIVCTPEEAYKCFMRTNMDYLVMGNFILDKKKQTTLKEDIDYKKEFELD